MLALRPLSANVMRTADVIEYFVVESVHGATTLELVTWQFGRAAVVDGLTAALALMAAALVFGTRVHSAWLILGGAAIGLARSFLS